MKKPIVLQVVPNLNSGGVERGTLEIADALIKQVGEAYVCSNGGKLVKSLEGLGANHIKLPVHSKNPLVIIANIFRLKHIIKKYKINIVHARSRAPAWSCYWACKLAGVVFITTFHGTYRVSNSIKKLYNSIMLKGQKVIAISNFIYNHIVANYEVDKDKLKVIHRGVDVNYFSPALVTNERKEKLLESLGLKDTDLQGKKVIVLPGRFTHWKGHLYLIEILSLLNDQDYLCLLVGEVTADRQKYLSAVKQAVKEHNLEAKILIKNAVSDMPALYSIADYVVSPSLQPEAFGRVIVEAQAMGKVVITTSHGGAAEESVEDNINGFYIPLNSALEAAKIVKKILSLPLKLYKEITFSAQQKVREKFTLEAMSKQTLQLYKELVNNKKNL